MAALNTHIHVTDDSGRAHVFAPGDDVPPWACVKITAPGVWAVPPGAAPETGPSEEELARAAEAAAREAEALRAADAAPREAKAAAVAGAEGGPSDNSGNAGEARTPENAAVPMPPKGGPGSGRPAWAEYAMANGVVVTDEMRSRDDIIAALALAGVPTD